MSTVSLIWSLLHTVKSASLCDVCSSVSFLFGSASAKYDFVFVISAFDKWKALKLLYMPIVFTKTQPRFKGFSSVWSWWWTYEHLCLQDGSSLKTHGVSKQLILRLGVCESPQAGAFSLSPSTSSLLWTKTSTDPEEEPKSFIHILHCCQAIVCGRIKVHIWANHRLSADTCGCQAQPFPARCRRLRRSARRLWWWAWWCGPGLSLSRFTISWSLLPSTLGRKSEALSVLRVLKPRRGRPLPLMETYHCLLALARRLLLPPPPGAEGCSVEWWREA